MMGSGYGGFGMMGGGSFMMILFLAAIGFLFYLALNKQNPKKVANITLPTADSEALKIVKSRLANGDISVEEFEQIKRNLL
ncbi:SHOCT domain-containing protein [Neobacillus sp. SAB-20_R2A]|uniref:SHOCT domain-containing protein n=1 Tax=Neobacillus sp. SAB-20_R2A TaxID=3120519 RepID=UPI003C6DB90A